MAEGKQAAQSSDSSTPFLEVECTTSGKVRRFALGTKADFALSLINNKLDAGAPPGLYLEAVKDGEEPITFGPGSVLVSYGNGWKLRTAVDYQGFEKRYDNQTSNATPNKRKMKIKSIEKETLGSLLKLRKANGQLDGHMAQTSAALEGMGFDSEQAAFDFYKDYARKTGFSFRKSYANESSKTGEMISRKFIFVKEGIRGSYKRDYKTKCWS